MIGEWFGPENSDSEELMHDLNDVDHVITLSQIVDDGILSRLRRKGLNHVVLCEGGKVFSPNTIKACSALGVPSVMVEGGIFHIDRMMKTSQGRKLLRELNELEYIVIVMNRKILLEGYEDTVNMLSNVKIIESVANAADFIKNHR